MKLLLILFPLLASAQTFNLGVQASRKNATVWRVELCSPATGSSTLPVGRIHTIMESHNITWLAYINAMSELHARQSKSKWMIAVNVVAALSTGVQLTASSSLIGNLPDAKRLKVQGFAGLGVSMFGVLIPLLKQQVPAPLEWETDLLRDSDRLAPPAGECSGGIILGGSGANFSLDLSK